DPANPSVLYMGTLVQGVFKSTDGGQSWEPANTGFAHQQIRHVVIDRHEARILYASAWGSGPFKSVDGGETWREIRRGIDRDFTTFIAMDPKDSNTLYGATASFTISLFKSTDGGESWTPKGPPV